MGSGSARARVARRTKLTDQLLLPPLSNRLGSQLVAEGRVEERLDGRPRHQAFQNASCTAAGVDSAKSDSRSAAAPGNPRAYQARCFLSCKSAVGAGRWVSISSQC